MFSAHLFIVSLIVSAIMLSVHSFSLMGRRFAKHPQLHMSVVHFSFDQSDRRKESNKSNGSQGRPSKTALGISEDWHGHDRDRNNFQRSNSYDRNERRPPSPISRDRTPVRRYKDSDFQSNDRREYQSRSNHRDERDDDLVLNNEFLSRDSPYTQTSRIRPPTSQPRYPRETREYNDDNRRVASNYRSIRQDNREHLPPVYGDFSGDHLFGVAPVLLALKSNRRKISELIIQVGMDSGNKKSEKSTLEILRLARERNIPIREYTKSDLNRMTENKVHQGFVLRASPLELKKVTQLEPTQEYRFVYSIQYKNVMCCRTALCHTCHLHKQTPCIIVILYQHPWLTLFSHTVWCWRWMRYRTR